MQQLPVLTKNPIQGRIVDHINECLLLLLAWAWELVERLAQVRPPRRQEAKVTCRVHSRTSLRLRQQPPMHTNWIECVRTELVPLMRDRVNSKNYWLNRWPPLPLLQTKTLWKTCSRSEFLIKHPPTWLLLNHICLFQSLKPSWQQNRHSQQPLSQVLAMPLRRNKLRRLSMATFSRCLKFKTSAAACQTGNQIHCTAKASKCLQARVVLRRVSSLSLKLQLRMRNNWRKGH